MMTFRKSRNSCRTGTRTGLTVNANTLGFVSGLAYPVCMYVTHVDMPSGHKHTISFPANDNANTGTYSGLQG
jgi:hypothetical protein